jgi:hypothetical protein
MQCDQVVQCAFPLHPRALALESFPRPEALTLMQLSAPAYRFQGRSIRKSVGDGDIVSPTSD